MTKPYYTKITKDNPIGFWQVYNETYEINVGLIISQYKKCKEELGAFRDMPVGCDGMVFESDNGSIFIWISEKGNVPTFAHECTHVISRIFKEKHIQHDLYNDEPYAYLMSWLFRMFYDKVK